MKREFMYAVGNVRWEKVAILDKTCGRRGYSAPSLIALQGEIVDTIGVAAILCIQLYAIDFSHAFVAIYLREHA
jgi:hypothetical protein